MKDTIRENHNLLNKMISIDKRMNQSMQILRPSTTTSHSLHSQTVMKKIQQISEENIVNFISK